jgi:hypothetical protein
MLHTQVTQSVLLYYLMPACMSTKCARGVQKVLSLKNQD